MTFSILNDIYCRVLNWYVKVRCNFFCNSFLIKSAFCNSINKIFIKGNQRIDSSTILSYLNIKKNKEISEDDLNAHLKTYLQQNYFLILVLT